MANKIYNEKVLEVFKDFGLSNSASLKSSVLDSRFSSQAEALYWLLQGENCFISGVAGAGKTTVINSFISVLETIKPSVRIAKTSTTGISATLIGGKTLNSFLRMGINKDPYNVYSQIRDNKFRVISAHAEIRKTDVLIIEEVSMLSASQMQFLLDIIKDALGSRWDRLQVVVVGDFSQLPPVASREDVDTYGLDIARFCYGSSAWNEFGFKNIFLDKCFRAEDEKLVRVLQSIENGKIDDSFYSIIEQMSDSSVENIDRAVLYTTNKKVDLENKIKQDANPNRLECFETKYDKSKFALSKQLAKENGIDDELVLKENDVVMVTRNGFSFVEKISCNGNVIDEVFWDSVPELSNGTICKYIGDRKISRIVDGNVYVYRLGYYRLEKIKRIVLGDTVREVVETYCEQLPLKLAYAISVHKSQGQTFDNLSVDLSNCWTAGLGYVALSRAKTLDSIHLIGGKYSSKAFLISEDSKRIKDSVVRSIVKSRKDDVVIIKNTVEDGCIPVFINGREYLLSFTPVVDESNKIVQDGLFDDNNVLELSADVSEVFE